MADENSSSVASVAIVLIVVIAALAFYFIFVRGVPQTHDDIRIKVDVPKAEPPEPTK